MPTITITHRYDPDPLRAAMKAQRVSQRELAQELDIHFTTICRVLAGSSASKPVIDKLCGRLNVPVSEVVSGPV